MDWENSLGYHVYDRFLSRLYEDSYTSVRRQIIWFKNGQMIFFSKDILEANIIGKDVISYPGNKSKLQWDTTSPTQKWL